ncbi:MAG: META domain-containing protein [Bacteroidota bacterium]
MKSLYFLPLLILLACNSQKQIPQEPENSLSIPTMPNFKASGYGPAWMLEIEEAKSIRFKSFGMGSFELLLPVPPAEINNETQETIYESESEQDKIQIRISRKACMDLMSGKSFDYEVIIKARPAEAGRDYMFEGCGMYIGDYRLNDIWVLKELNGLKIFPKDYARGAPHIELNLSSQRMLGYAGCNEMNSEIVIAEQTIHFNSIGTTKMMCQTIDFETKFTRALSNKTLNYKLQGLFLLLNDEENRLVFQKGD